MLLHELIAEHREEIIARIRAGVGQMTAPVQSEDDLQNGVRLLLGQLVALLSVAERDSGAIRESAVRYGGELLGMGFSVGQVVRGYGEVRQAVTALAHEKNASIAAADFHLFNHFIDHAIASAVIEYERLRDASVADQETERLAVLGHEMHSRISVGMLAFDCLCSGTVAVNGSTGALLGRSLRSLRDLVSNALAGVRLDSGGCQHRRVSISDIVGEMETEAFLEATARGFKLTVAPPPRGVDVEGDPQILAASIGNLLQNAFKFSHKYGHVALRASATADRARIEVEDECGGLLPGKVEDFARPFEPQSSKRAGVGLGLSISRRGVEAMGGTLGVRDLPGKGCIFAIELPRLDAPGRP